MYTRESALEYSCALIHELVFECSRTELSRQELCEKLNATESQVSMWITGSRTCQLYWVIKNAEELVEELKKLPDKHFTRSGKTR